VMFFNAKDQAEKALGLQDGDNIILTGGMINGASGNTNLIKVETMRKR
jgi:pyruvate kinase